MIYFNQDMENNIELVPLGSITSPQGFQAGAISANIKSRAGSALDLGILSSEVPAAAAAVFTTNRVKAAPVLWSQKQLKMGRAQAVVINSGCANAFTGKEGLEDAAEIAGFAARKTGLKPGDVVVSSTGLIGTRLPMEQVKDGIGRIVLSRDGGHKLAQAIMTTDTVPKEIALTCRVGMAGLPSVA